MDLLLRVDILSGHYDKLRELYEDVASYPGSLGEGEKRAWYIYCLRMRLIKIGTTREFEFLRKRKMGGATMTYNNKPR